MGALARYPARRLELEFGLSRAGALRLSAAFALGRRVERAPRAPRRRCARRPWSTISSRPTVRGSKRETFHALLLDGKHRLQGSGAHQRGDLTCSLVHPREVFGPALARRCGGVDRRAQPSPVIPSRRRRTSR
jgi:DNA repair protein RadC